jgi:hypothetical protein
VETWSGLLAAPAFAAAAIGELGEHQHRPKGMHHATWIKVMAAILACEELRDRALYDFM